MDLFTAVDIAGRPLKLRTLNIYCLEICLVSMSFVLFQRGEPARSAVSYAGRREGGVCPGQWLACYTDTARVQEDRVSINYEKKYMSIVYVSTVYVH